MPTTSQREASSSASFASANEDQVSSPAISQEEEETIHEFVPEEHQEAVGIQEEEETAHDSVPEEDQEIVGMQEDLDTRCITPSNNENEPDDRFQVPLSPVAVAQVSNLWQMLEKTKATNKKLEDALEASLFEVEAQDKQIKELTTQVYKVKVQLHECRLKVRRRDSQIMDLHKRLESRCEAIDGSHIRLPCFNKICTHPSNDKHDEEEVLRAIGKEGVEKERLLKLCVNQSMEHAPKRPSLGEPRMTASENSSGNEIPISELSLGEPLLAVPQTLLAPKASAAPHRHPHGAVNQSSTAVDEEFESFSGLSMRNQIPDIMGASMLSKATPISTGYFQNSRYLEEAKKKVTHIVDTYQSYPKGTIKLVLEELSASLVSSSNTKTSGEVLGRDLNAVGIQRARERFDAYAPAWEDQDTLMKPILHLAQMRVKQPRNLPDMDDSPFSLGPPAIPIPLPLILEELLNKVEKDGQTLHGVKEYVRNVNTWKKEAELREELNEQQIKSLENQVAILKRDQRERSHRNVEAIFERAKGQKSMTEILSERANRWRPMSPPSVSHALSEENLRLHNYQPSPTVEKLRQDMERLRRKHLGGGGMVGGTQSRADRS